MTTVERANELELEVQRLRGQLQVLRAGMAEMRLISQALRELVELRTAALVAPRAAARHGNGLRVIRRGGKG